MDALTHAIEAYISINASQETDAYALAATRLIMQNLPKVMVDGADLVARQSMAQASDYAGLAITKASLGYVHAISHNLGGYYGTLHGIGNAIVLPYVLEYSKGAATLRLTELAEVSGLKLANESDEALAEAFIYRIKSMLGSFDIPSQLDARRVEDIPSIAKRALKEAHYNYPVPRYLDHKGCEALLTQMLAN
ncbi:dehydroquinate synthase/iron-containing alcohol dehydrogenase family protein [Alkalimarinus alittae]|uniref:Iron-containing alcohol dehydrogenase n=1 Tax=Alkalimarinus alittae TaxID=2961619 RepID=A0ABY6N4I3_9ALTE|nr:iron-containing alcohol dehydrogenase [Alkalimarinus alittae]UZE96874.1 iron-containing alcohol dehydrogenase [Alkalimarinus alittae]